MEERVCLHEIYAPLYLVVTPDTEVQKQKTLRNEANSRVAELRKIRLEKTNELKEVRAKLRSSVENNDQDKLDITLKINKILEKMIIKNPTQWLWSHNRWK